MYEQANVKSIYVYITPLRLNVVSISLLLHCKLTKEKIRLSCIGAWLSDVRTIHSLFILRLQNEELSDSSVFVKICELLYEEKDNFMRFGTVGDIQDIFDLVTDPK